MNLEYVHSWDTYHDYETTVFVIGGPGNVTLDLALTLNIDGDQRSAYITLWLRSDIAAADQLGEFPVDWDNALALLGDAELPKVLQQEKP